MGQYYETLFIDERQWMYPLDYGCSGLKLTEHSWIGGSYRNAVIAHLMKLSECRMVHVGDYSEEMMDERLCSKDALEIDDHVISGKTMYDMCWTSGIEDKFKMPRISDFDINEFRWKKKVWIADEKLHEYIECPFDIEEDDKWELCPLLILLAIGNGQGGGDYHGTNMDKVGTWAFHKIKVYYEEPHWMEKLENIFEENLR